MNQKQYLRTLSRALYLYVPWEERQDILSDYREYFSDGISQGESEAQIISRLGPPNVAAREILSERGAFTISKQVILKAVSFLIAMILFGLAIWFFYNPFFSHGYSDFGYFLDSIAPQIILLIALINFFLRSSSWRSKPKQKNRPFWIASASVSVFLILGIVLSITLFFIPSVNGAFPELDPSTIGPLTASIFTSLGGIGFLAWLWLLIGTRNRTPMCQSLNFWFAGLIGILHKGGWFLRSLDDPAYFYTFQIWVDWLWPVVLGMILTAIAMLVSYFLSKRGKT